MAVCFVYTCASGEFDSMGSWSCTSRSFGLIVAMCITAFCNASGITLSVNYLVDCYRDNECDHCEEYDEFCHWSKCIS